MLNVYIWHFAWGEVNLLKRNILVGLVYIDDVFDFYNAQICACVHTHTRVCTRVNPKVINYILLC